MSTLLAWLKATPYFKTGTIVTVLSGIAGILTALQSLPADASGTMIAIFVIGAVLKLVNPADSKTTVTGA